MTSSFPPLLQARISNHIAQRSLDCSPRRISQHSRAVREIHSLENIWQTMEECAESEFGDWVEVAERVQAAQINRRGFGVIVHGCGNIAHCSVRAWTAA